MDTVRTLVSQRVASFFRNTQVADTDDSRLVVSRASRCGIILIDTHGIILFTVPPPSRCAPSRSARSASASRPSVVNGHRPAAITTNGSKRHHVGPPGWQREQLPVLVVQVDPVLAPVLAVDDELEVLAAQGMERVRHPDASVPIERIRCS